MKLSKLLNPGAVIGVAAALLLSIAAIQGCSIGDIVMVDVPQGIQDVTGSPPRVSFNESQRVFDKWVFIQQQDGQSMTDSMEQSAKVVGLFSSLMNQAIQNPAIAASIGALPLGGTLMYGLGVLTTLFTNPPGSKKRDEKRFNKGIAVGKGIVE